MSAPTVQAPTFPLSPTELGKWSRFAIKGGIGRAVAKEDRIAEGMDQLMFIQGDELVVLIDLGKGEYIVSPGLGAFSEQQANSRVSARARSARLGSENVETDY